MNRFNRLELRALVLRDLFGAGLVPENYYGKLREYDIETEILDCMLGRKLRFSAACLGLSIRQRRAAELLIHFGFYQETTLRANLAKDRIYTLRQLFGPLAATTDFLNEFEDIPKFPPSGGFGKILAMMEHHFPDLVRAYVDCLPEDDQAAISAYTGNILETSSSVDATAGAIAKGITKQQVINAFEGMHFNRDQWSNALADAPKWLARARVIKGNKKTSALWNPVQIAVELSSIGISVKKLDAVFINLKDWIEEWQAAREYLSN
ncbi:MAG: hypothetical protein J0H48_01460 [Nitrosospira multiformis]|nr:hypothetical protein [Nitrosospira multiformis]